GGPAETVVHGQSGYLFHSLEELMELTLRLTSDETERRRLSEGARRRAEEFSMDRFRQQVTALVSGSGKVSVVPLPPLEDHHRQALARWTPPGYEAPWATAASPSAPASDHSRPYVLYLRPWVEALPGWLEPLVDLLEREPSVGAVSPLLLCPDGTLVEGVTFADDGLPRPCSARPDAPQVPVIVEAPFPSCILVRREWALPPAETWPGAEVCLAQRLRRAGLAVAVHRGSIVRLTLRPRPLHELWPQESAPFRQEWGSGLPGTGEMGRPLWRAGEATTWPRTIRLKMA
ncbi:MAG TPA: hypothetical protein VNL95_09610, partial [Dehalococcoidia bacterium]|nr:hypothetical protein [Dehalococcoidia bacterium]